MHYNHHTLSNGLRIIHQPSLSKVAYCGFAINAGTRDELEDEHGMAHFVEHMIFKGTEKRSALRIMNYIEKVGAEINAYTTKEETVVYSAFLKEDFNRAADLLADIVFHSVFPQREIDKEVNVVLDEIMSYEDNPSELIFDDFEDMIFSGHSLGRNILGNPETLKTFNTEKILSFTKRYYHPSNMVFFVQGDINFNRIIDYVEKLTKGMSSSSVVIHRTPPPAYMTQNITMSKDTHQVHVIMGNRSYAASDEKRTALYLLNNILGGPSMNSRLNMALREKRGLVYNVESNLTSYTDTGVFGIYFATHPRYLDKCISYITNELIWVSSSEIAPHILDSAKRQIIGQIGVASDNNENNALNMAKTFLHYNNCETPETIFERIRSVNPYDIKMVASEVVNYELLSSLTYK